jgi:hypothetical protein
MGVLDREYLGMGVEVQKFEQGLSAYFNRPVLCVVNGTASLHLALQAAGIGVGDEVLVMEEVKYYLDSTSGSEARAHPKLMKARNGQPAEIFAEDIVDLQFVYILGGAMPDRTFLRLGGAFAIAGSALLLVFNILHPRAAEPSTEATLRVISQSLIWIPDHLGLLLSGLLVVGGLIALSDSISGSPAVAFARFGRASAVASAGSFAIVIGIDGIAAKRVADAWALSPSTHQVAAAALEDVTNGNFSIFILVFFGVTFLLYGLAVSTSQQYPRWLGWAAAVLSVAALLVGLTMAFSGPSGPVFMAFVIVSLLLTIWTLVMGILMWRRAEAL